MKKIAVVGSGTIGHGIAQILAMNSYQVVMLGTSDDRLQKSKEKIRSNLDKSVEKKKLTTVQADSALKRISLTTSYEQACEGIDFAIEAVPENLELKCKAFATLDLFASPHAIFASATSALSITEIGKVIQRPERIAGMHFFNPPQQMPLVEIIKGAKTSQDTVDALTSLAVSLGKKAIVVGKDVCGSVVNRILYAVFLEAFWTYHRKEATKEEIDSSVKYKGGFPMGWFELADFAGLDIVNEVGKSLYQAYDGRFEQCLPVLEPLIKEKKFGQKTGMGFYDWTHGRPIIPSSLQDSYDVVRSWVVAVNEAAWLICNNASPEDIDIAMKLGTYWPSGPCEQGDSIGLDVVMKKLEELYCKFKLQIYKPCPLLTEYINKGWTGKKAGQGFYKYSAKKEPEVLN